MDRSSVAESFDTWARIDPFWAICGGRDKKNGGWEQREFFESGVVKIDEVVAVIDQHGFPLRRINALDFGCGAGRLTQALAPRFSHVVGVDASPAMLELAERFNRYPEKCRYALNVGATLQNYQSDSFDFVISIVVLQHLEAGDSTRFIRELVRILGKGGMLVFQMIGGKVSAEEQSLISQEERASWKTIDGPAIEMHPVPREEVIRHVEDSGGSLLKVIENRSGGPLFVSYDYYVTKPSAPDVTRPHTDEAP